MRRIIAALRAELAALRGENAALRKELAALKPNHPQAAAKPAANADVADEIKEGMTRLEVFKLMGRKPDRERSSSDGSSVVIWNFQREETIADTGTGGYRGVQFDIRNIDPAAVNPPPRLIPAGSVTVYFKDNKVTRAEKEKR